MPLQEGKRKNVNHINFGFVLPSFCHDTPEVHGPQRIGKPELLPHGMANVDGVSTKPLDQNSGHKWVKVNTMLSHRDLYDLCRTPLADFLDRVNQADQRPSHRALESIERLPLKSVLIASEMLAFFFVKLSHVAGAKSLELATPLVQAPYDVLRNNIEKLTKRPKWEKHGRSQSNHPLAKDPALVEMMVRHWAHVHGVCDSLGQCRHFPRKALATSSSITCSRTDCTLRSGSVVFKTSAETQMASTCARWFTARTGNVPGNPETGKADCVRQRRRAGGTRVSRPRRPWSRSAPCQEICVW